MQNNSHDSVTALCNVLNFILLRNGNKPLDQGCPFYGRDNSCYCWLVRGLHI
jgi:hypothetical protein